MVLNVIGLRIPFHVSQTKLRKLNKVPKSQWYVITFKHGRKKSLLEVIFNFNILVPYLTKVTYQE